MEWDISRVYTAVNADEVKVGSKVIVGNNLSELKYRFESGAITTIAHIRDENYNNRFEVIEWRDCCNLCYLISEPEEKKLKWTDLKIGDVIRAKDGSVERLVTGIFQNSGDFNIHIEAGSTALSDKNLELWEKV